MTDTLRKLSAAALLSWFVPLFFVFVEGIYGTWGQELPSWYSILQLAMLGWVFGWWVRRDDKLPGLRRVYDVGYVLCLAWQLFLPYYLLKTRWL